MVSMFASFSIVAFAFVITRMNYSQSLRLGQCNVALASSTWFFFSLTSLPHNTIQYNTIVTSQQLYPRSDTKSYIITHVYLERKEKAKTKKKDFFFSFSFRILCIVCIMAMASSRAHARHAELYSILFSHYNGMFAICILIHTYIQTCIYLSV